MTSEPADDVHDWLLERYRLGELPNPERRRVKDALERDAEVRERLDDLDLSSQALLREYPPPVLVAAVRERTRIGQGRAPARGVRPWTPLAAASVVAASLAGVAVWRPWTGTPTEDVDVTRVKGLTPYLLLYRKASRDVERLPPAAVARPHDVVQLAYQAGARRYGVILSVDGRGVITRHLVDGAQAAPLTPGTPVALPQSYELDDAPGFERFVLVTADEPFAVAEVEGAVRRQHAALGAQANERRLELPASMDQFSLVVRKEPSR